MTSAEPDIKKLYYSISEVCDLTNLKSYVLRYWETEFRELHPPKNRAGNRTYRQKDIDTILKIKHLLYDKKFTIEGARNQLALMPQDFESESTEDIAEDMSESVMHVKGREVLREIRDQLKSVMDLINN